MDTWTYSLLIGVGCQSLKRFRWLRSMSDIGIFRQLLLPLAPFVNTGGESDIGGCLQPVVRNYSRWRG